MKYDVSKFSNKYSVRLLNDKDIEDIYNLCKGNPLYYQYDIAGLSYDSIRTDMIAYPEGRELTDKYYFGYYDKDKLVAVCDIVDGYPESDIAFIGFFMVDKEYSGKGIGSNLIEELVIALKEYGIKRIRLAWIKGNSQPEHFWIKNGFKVVRETVSLDIMSVILAERVIA